MPYDNNEIMRNVPERLRSKVKGIGAPPTITDEPQETSNFDLPVFGPIAGNTITFNKAAELASNAIDTIKETIHIKINDISLSPKAPKGTFIPKNEAIIVGTENTIVIPVKNFIITFKLLEIIVP